MRLCSGCGELKAENAFVTWSHETKCRICVRQRARDHRARNRESINQKKRAYYHSCANAQDRQRHKDKQKNLRLLVIAQYGGTCVCCGEKRIEFLTIDHVFGGGNAHRREIGRSNLYKWLKKSGWPKEGFRLLCWNCNMSRGAFGGCPHDFEKRKLKVVQ